MINFISSVLIILIKIISTALAALSQKYSIQVDNSIGHSVSSSLWLIQSYQKSDETLCLVECSLKKDCYTATYSSDSSLIDNCALYSKYFATSDLVSLKNTNLYSKDCEWNFNIIISLLM